MTSRSTRPPRLNARVTMSLPTPQWALPRWRLPSSKPWVSILRPFLPLVLRERACFRRHHSSNPFAKAGSIDKGRPFGGVLCLFSRGRHCRAHQPPAHTNPAKKLPQAAICSTSNSDFQIPAQNLLTFPGLCKANGSEQSVSFVEIARGEVQRVRWAGFCTVANAQPPQSIDPNRKC